MKKAFKIFILGVAITGFAQKLPAQKNIINSSNENQTQVVELGEMAQLTSEIDTIDIYAGKSYIILIDIDVNSSGRQIVGGNLKNEADEVRANFQDHNIEIIVLTNHAYIIFENKQILDVSDRNILYQSFTYWSGKSEDNIEVQEGTYFATEFVAGQMGVKKESSYALNARMYKAEVALLQSKNNITENSRIVMNAFLSEISSAFPGKAKDEDADLFILKGQKVKSIQSFLHEKDSKVFLKSISFNEKGQPTLIKFYSSSGEENGVVNFEYENSMLSKITYQEGKTATVNYDNYTMIISQNVGDANETMVLRMENNMFLYKEYTLMIDDAYSYQNFFVEEKNENNCKVRYHNNEVWTRKCSGKINIFPYIHQYTSFQDGELLQYRKSKIVKKDEKTFEKYYSNEEDEEYQFWGTIQLNEQNLVATYTFTKDNETKVLKIDYTYYP